MCVWQEVGMPSKLPLYELNHLHQGFLMLEPDTLPSPSFWEETAAMKSRYYKKDDKIFLIYQSILRSICAECIRRRVEFLG